MVIVIYYLKKKKTNITLYQRNITLNMKKFMQSGKKLNGGSW